MLRVTGSKRRIEALGDEFGRVVRPSMSTDIVTLAVGLCRGALIGARLDPDRRHPLRRSARPSGLLLAGIALSIVRTRNPAFGGPFPEPARQLLEDLGLNVFIAVLGPQLGRSGADVLGGELATIRARVRSSSGSCRRSSRGRSAQFAFKMNSALLMGAVAGARCNTAGMRASQEDARARCRRCRTR